MGLRPTPGLVSGGGMGPMTRTVRDLAIVLDVIAGEPGVFGSLTGPRQARIGLPSAPWR